MFNIGLYRSGEAGASAGIVSRLPNHVATGRFRQPRGRAPRPLPEPVQQHVVFDLANVRIEDALCVEFGRQPYMLRYVVALELGVERPCRSEFDERTDWTGVAGDQAPRRWTPLLLRPLGPGTASSSLAVI